MEVLKEFSGTVLKEFSGTVLKEFNGTVLKELFNSCLRRVILGHGLELKHIELDLNPPIGGSVEVVVARDQFGVELGELGRLEVTRHVPLVGEVVFALVSIA